VLRPGIDGEEAEKGEEVDDGGVYTRKGKGCNIITLPEPHTSNPKESKGSCGIRGGGGSRWLLKSFVPLPVLLRCLSTSALTHIEFTWCFSWAGRYEGLADENLNVLVPGMPSAARGQRRTARKSK